MVLSPRGRDWELAAVGLLVHEATDHAEGFMPPGRQKPNMFIGNARKHYLLRSSVSCSIRVPVTVGGADADCRCRC
jgi:hypothetical protein